MKLSNIRICIVLLTAILNGFLDITAKDASKTRIHTYHSELVNDDSKYLSSGFYLVIGVFEFEQNAQRMVDYAQKEGLAANYKLYPKNSYYYVYTCSSNDKEQMVEKYTQLRNSTIFSDAWLLLVRNINADTIKTISTGHVELEVVAENKAKEVSEEPVYFREPDVEKEEVEKDTHPVIVVQTNNVIDGQRVEASIELVDGMRAKLIDKIKNEEPYEIENIEILDTVQVVSEALGFRKMQLDLIPKSPINDTTALYTHIENDTIFLQMDLIELQEGDFQIMYNTYFYGNSTVMRDHSRYELEKLFNIMDSKPAMKIRLHGHTNGNSRGVAYLFDEEGKNYFEIRRTKEYTKNGVSSKKLSAYRAETIKSYLVNQGIAADRIETKGWGGDKLLYETDSPLAKNNIRVEIEVLSK